jgi:hypothetical protein
LALFAASPSSFNINEPNDDCFRRACRAQWLAMCRMLDMLDPEMYSSMLLYSMRNQLITIILYMALMGRTVVWR